MTNFDLVLQKKMHKCKNSDLSWALHSLDCLEANIFKTTFFARFLHISRHFWQRKMTSLGSYLKWHLAPVFCRLKKKTPALIWRNFFSRPKRNGIFANNYFFFTLAVFSLNVEQLLSTAHARKRECEKNTKLFGFTYFHMKYFSPTCTINYL